MKHKSKSFLYLRSELNGTANMENRYFSFVKGKKLRENKFHLSCI